MSTFLAVVDNFRQISSRILGRLSILSALLLAQCIANQIRRHPASRASFIALALSRLCLQGDPSGASWYNSVSVYNNNNNQLYLTRVDT